MEPIETGYRPNGQFCVLYLGNEEIRECVLQTDRFLALNWVRFVEKSFRERLLMSVDVKTRGAA